MEENQTFGERLKWLREQTGRSQTYMADVLGVHSSQISRWERGRARPTPDQLVQIIQFLGTERPARIPQEKWEQFLQCLMESYGQNPILSMIQTLLERSQRLPRLRERIQKFLWDLCEILEGLIETDEAIQGRQWQQAEHRLQQLTKKLEGKYFSDRLSLELDRSKSFVYYRLFRYELALETIEQVIAQAEKISDLRTQGEVLVLRGDLKRRIGQFDEARQDFRTAIIRCYNQLNGQEGIYGKVRCYRKMAITYLLRGWPKRAEEELVRARLANEQLGDFTEGFKIQQAQAWIYLQQGRWDQAVEEHRNVVSQLQARRKDLDPWVLAKAFRYIGDAYRIARQYRDAEDFYNKAQNICTKLREQGRDTRLIEAMIALGLARIKIKQQNTTEAQDWIERAKRFIEDIKMDSRIPEVKMELAELMWKLKNQKAYDLLYEAQKQFKQFKHWAYYAQCETILCQWLVAEAEAEPSEEDWKQVTDMVNGIYHLAFDPPTREMMVDAEAPLPAHLSDEIPLLYHHLAIAKKEQGRLGLWMDKIEEGEQALQEALTYASRFNSRFLQEVFEAIKQLFENLDSRNSQKTMALRERFRQWLAAHKDPYLRQMADQI